MRVLFESVRGSGSFVRSASSSSFISVRQSETCSLSEIRLCPCRQAQSSYSCCGCSVLGCIGILFDVGRCRVCSPHMLTDSVAKPACVDASSTLHRGGSCTWSPGRLTLNPRPQLEAAESRIRLRIFGKNTTKKLCKAI